MDKAFHGGFFDFAINNGDSVSSVPLSTISPKVTSMEEYS